LVLGAVIDTPCGNLHVFSTHLSIAPRQNARQIHQLQHWVEKLCGGHTGIIGGDFNAHETKPGIKRIQSVWVDTFRHVNPDSAGSTHELRGPLGKAWRSQRLDYIFLQPGTNSWQVVDASHLHNPKLPHSDHQAVMTRLIPDKNGLSAMRRYVV
jgi:endonuclease/exonuclease/phosphatase family metal-dependent hydrolase